MWISKHHIDHFMTPPASGNIKIKNQDPTRSSVILVMHPSKGDPLEIIVESDPFTLKSGSPHPKPSVILIEYYFNEADPHVISPRKTLIHLEPGARLKHFILKQGPRLASFQQESQFQQEFHFQQELRVEQDAFSDYEAVHLLSPGKKDHTQIDIHLKGEGAKSHFWSGIFPIHQQQAELSLTIHHQASDCQSKCVARAILGSQSKGHFHGKILNHALAKGTSTHLEGKGLLLSESSEFSVKPEFEIHNDNLRQCTHGATVGHLDQESLFYLKSRGLNELTAQKFLMDAFMQTIYDTFSESPTLEFLNHFEKDWLQRHAMAEGMGSVPTLGRYQK